jgi:hypothetical protein
MVGLPARGDFRRLEKAGTALNGGFEEERRLDLVAPFGALVAPWSDRRGDSKTLQSTPRTKQAQRGQAVHPSCGAR